MTANDNQPASKVSEEALGKAEQKLEMEQDKRVRDAAIADDVSTEPEAEEKKPETDPAV